VSLPATDNFTGTNGDSLNGRTTTTGALTWSSDGFTIQGNKATGASSQHAIVNAGVADVVVQATLGSSPNFAGLVFRSNSGYTQCLIAYFTTVNVYIFDETVTQLASATGTFASGDVVSVSVSGTAITVKQNGTTVLTYTSSHGLTNIYVGLSAAASNTFDDFSVAAVITTPTARLLRANLTTAYLAGTAAGGTSPQWSRSTSPDSGFVNLSNGGGVSGATSDDLVDGSVTPGTLYYYKVTYTGSGASNVQAGETWGTPAYCGFIGDSVLAGFGNTTNPVEQFELAIRGMANTQRDVATHNAAAGGLSTSDWYNSANVGSEVQTRLSDALNAFIGDGLTHVMVQLGINDANSGAAAAVYQVNLQGIADYVISRGLIPILCYPTGFTKDGTGALSLAATYLAKIDAIVGGGGDILLGDTLGWRLFQDRAADLLQGGVGVHPGDDGDTVLGSLLAWGFVRAVGEATGGGSGGVLQVGAMTGGLQRS
jgi:hypothetical protein